jgi:hypothetical protein
VATAVSPPGAFNISSVYKPWPRQILFHKSGAKNRLQVGSFGSGKSRPLLWEGIFHALEYPGSESLILRKTTPDLKRTVISKFLSDVPKEIYQRYNETDRTVYFHPQPKFDEHGNPMYSSDGQPLTVQSKLYFHPCDRDVDVNNYLSTEYVFIGFEELGEFSFAIWDALANRNRCPIPGSRACMAAATNPYGAGWSWIKKLWGCGKDKKSGLPLVPKPLPGMDPEKFRASDYEYIHSTVDDNPIYIKDEEYIRKLESSPNRDVVRWGNLDAISGLYFDNYIAETIERSKEDFVWQHWQPVWVGWDYGFGHYATIFFVTKAMLKPRLKGQQPKMVNVVIAERILQESTPEQQTNSLILTIPSKKDAQGEIIGRAWEIDSVHFSWERFNRVASNRTIADEVGDILAAAGLPRPVRSNNDRVAGWTKMYSLFESEDLYILKDECPTLCEAIPQLPRVQPGKGNIEDVEKPKGVSLFDDCGDGVRYAISGMLLDAEDKPREVQYEEELAKITDPMARFEKQYREFNRQKKEAEAPRKQIVIPSWRARLQKPK